MKNFHSLLQFTPISAPGKSTQRGNSNLELFKDKFEGEMATQNKCVLSMGLPSSPPQEASLVIVYVTNFGCLSLGVSGVTHLLIRILLNGPCFGGEMY